ncbi:MAG TPA: hypothetical protein VNR39_13290 [Pseudolabrys sp.]|nr:hypothetical protein [Pseudolabrys sp.]
MDAARLLIAAAGSQFAEDSLRVLQDFAKLKPLGGHKARILEEFLAMRIDDFRYGLDAPTRAKSPKRWRARKDSNL